MPDTIGVRALSVLAGMFAGTLVAQQPADAPDVEADRLIAERKYEAAIRRLDACIAANPKSSALYYQRAYSKGAKGDVEGALPDADKAVELDPSNAYAWIERGYLKHTSGRSREAIADFDRAIELDPENRHAHGDRGDARQALGEFERAIADYDEAIRIDPRFGAAFYNRGRCRRELGQLLTARADFRRAARFLPQPHHPQFWHECAGIEADLGMWRAALDSAAKAVALAPEDWSLRSQRGRLAWRGNLVERGLDDLQAAAAQDQDATLAADAIVTLGCIRLCSGEDEAAAAAFRRAAEKDEDGVGPWAALMRWCAERRSAPAAADATLAAFTTGAGLTEQQLELVDLCTRGDGDSAELPLREREPHEACPLLFFSGWRAATSGRREEALRKLVRCVNTGQNYWLQWQVAADHVRQWTEDAPLRVGFGVELAADPDGGAVRVRKVVEGLAADLQGLKAGDTIQSCNHEPATLEGWNEACRRLEVGLPVKLSVLRDGAVLQLRLFAGLEPR